jgi:hypothetical protein
MIKAAASAGADALAEREVRSIETDILNGSPPPGSRLGIIETAARCGARPTLLRDALSWLAPRGLKRDRQAGLWRIGVAAGPRGNRAHSYRRRARSVAAQHSPLNVSLLNDVVPFDRNAPRSTHGSLVGVSTRSKPSSSKRLPSRCEKAGQGNDVLRTLALKSYGKHGERDDRER